MKNGEENGRKNGEKNGEKTVPETDEKGRFVKGNKGGPGRGNKRDLPSDVPRVEDALQRVYQLAVGIMETSKDDKTRLAAGKMVKDLAPHLESKDEVDEVEELEVVKEFLAWKGERDIRDAGGGDDEAG